MKANRRRFLSTAALGSIAYAARFREGTERQQSSQGRIRAVAFDAFVIFDPRAVVNCAEELFPGKGGEFTNLWRTRQFEYTWLRTTGQRYRDFWLVTEDAMDYAARSMQLQISEAQRQRLMSVYRELPVWPDTSDAIAELQDRGLRMAFLSNFTASMLDANLHAAKMSSFFEEHLSTDSVRAFKPSTRAYRMGTDHFGLGRHEIAFAAFAPWDVAGAKWFGYPTIWVNRMSAAEELLGAKPDAVTSGAAGLWDVIRRLSAGR